MKTVTVIEIDGHDDDEIIAFAMFQSGETRSSVFDATVTYFAAEDSVSGEPTAVVSLWTD